MSLSQTGSGIAILLLCIQLLQHQTLTRAAVLSFQLPFCVFPLQQTLPGREGEKVGSPQNAAFSCPEPRKQLRILPPSSQLIMNLLSFSHDKTRVIMRDAGKGLFQFQHA